MTDSSLSGESDESSSSSSRWSAADNEAMVRLRGGDDSALNELMDRWRKPILAYLYRAIGDYETAADLSQEVFVRLYRSRRSYQPSGAFSSFIFTIAANLARNHFRWKKRHPEAELSDEVIANIGDSPGAVDPARRLEKNEDCAAVRAAVQSLPEKLKTPVILFHFNELSHQEIAGILRCSVKTVETRLYRGRKSLRKLLRKANG